MSTQQLKSHEKYRSLSPYTTPKINKDNPDKWYIYFNHAVPPILRKLHPDLYPRSTKRIKVYRGINSKSGAERDKFADEVREVIEYALKIGVYNPFEKPLSAIVKADDMLKNYQEKKEHNIYNARYNTSVADALKEYIQSRIERKIKKKSITTCENTVNWLVDGIPKITINAVTYLHVSKAMTKIATAKGWSATTINKEWEFANTAFRWLLNEEYIKDHPLEGRIVKLKTKKSIHKWYDKETAFKVKEELKKVPWLQRVCQFTYWILIRSQSELQAIKIGDIDFDLHQVKFRKEWAKNGSDQNRDYGPEFAQIIEEMGLKDLPKDWYIFGKGGVPGPKQCGHNFFSLAWAEIRNRLKLSALYTIYGWKHTRIVHMMMLNKSPYEIAHAARHGAVKTGDDYKRDYDFNLTKVYKPEDLTF